MTEMYSGVIPLNMSDESRGMFFVYQPRVGPPVDEVTIWFNGGPGKGIECRKDHLRPRSLHHRLQLA
jgi:hypothetical protein